MSKNIRELVEKAIEDAMDVGAFSGLPLTPAKQRARHDQQESRAALLAAIDRLERKAATAKAEADAWREQEAATNSGYTPIRTQAEANEMRARVDAANKALRAARAATDEAWREPAPVSNEEKR